MADDDRLLLSSDAAGILSVSERKPRARVVAVKVPSATGAAVQAFEAASPLVAALAQAVVEVYSGMGRVEDGGHPTRSSRNDGPADELCRQHGLILLGGGLSKEDGR